jgi:acyl transferase domain-containing protein
MAVDRNPERGSSHESEIAIVGMSARFPGCRTVGEYWAKVSAGKSLLSSPTPEDLAAAGIDSSAAQAMHLVTSGTKLEEAEWFDARFFGMTRREAEMMDPQQRVFLECAYEALEDAGIALADGRSSLRVGVFGGIGMNTYMLQLLGNPELLAAAGGYQLMLGNDKDFLATRVAFKLNLTGPAVAVQTACSTSLAAVHLACQSLKAGECDAALAGGVSIAFPQVAAYDYIPGMILSPDGVCRPFDSRANGTVPGRGAGLVVLKRLVDAEADGDTIYAVIAGSAWNNDGSGKVGYTAPSVAGQAAVIRGAQDAAGVTPDKFGYVEAHGTGTELGDPIEVAALAEVFDAKSVGKRSCVLGSVKANMGHADVAAGIAGLIKAALAIRHGVIPGTPHFERANSALGLERTHFQVSAAQSQWPEGELEHWAGVSSFGIGGTNVHVCLRGVSLKDETAMPADETPAPLIFPVSAKTPSALSAAGLRLSEFLSGMPVSRLSQVARTLQSGRLAYACRRALVATTLSELELGLSSDDRKEKNNSGASAEEVMPKIAFLFPGQGQQFDGMASGLYEQDSSFRGWINRGLSCLPDDLAAGVLSAICGGEIVSLAAAETALAQPLLFLVEYALGMRWMEIGVRPDALLGHSLGELSAAALAGVFSFEDAMRLAAERGRLMQDTVEGAMLAVSLPLDQIAPYLTDDLWIAAENGPKLTVLSGSVDAIEQAEVTLRKARTATVRLQTNRAFHSPNMADAASQFGKAVEAVERKMPALPWLSNVTGTWITAEEAMSPQYWADQITSRVRFRENADVLNASRSPYLLLEVGPGEALGTLARRKDTGQTALSTLGQASGRNRVSKGDLRSFLEAVARVWEKGISIQWDKLPGNETSGLQRVSLPTYPFERERFWVEKTETSSEGRATGSRSDSLVADGNGLRKRPDIASWFYALSFQRTPAATYVNASQKEAITTWIVVQRDQQSESSREEFSFAAMMQRVLVETGCEVISVVAGSEANFDDLFHEHAERLKTGANGLIFCLPASGEGSSSHSQSATAFGDYILLLGLLKAAARTRTRFAQLELIAESLTEMNGERLEDPDRAILEGLARILPVEFRSMSTRTIDPGESLRSNPQVAAANVLAEIRTIAVPGTTVAYRGTSRWQQVLLPVHVEAPAISGFRQGGVYVITGGLGGVGYAIARYLARNYNAKLALLGRTVLPPRGMWEEWITEHGPNHPVSRRIERVKSLEALGGELLLMQVDVADAAAMDSAWEKIEQDFGTVHGVIHAAGLTSAERFVAQTAESVADVFRPKIQASKVLAELLIRKESREKALGQQGAQTKPPLDFLLFCSSISSVVPLAGATAYSAANTFQDRYGAWCAQQLGLPVVVVNFDGWQEVGMIAESSGAEGFQADHEARLKFAMRVEEGLQVLERVLASGEKQLLVSTVDLALILAELLKDRAPSADADVAATSVGVLNASDKRMVAHGEAGVSIATSEETQAVIAIWKELLGAEQIDPSDNFFELGGHSLVGTMVLARVREQFGVELGIRAIFDAPTPESLGLRIRQAEPVIQAAETAEGIEEEVIAGEDREDFEF